MDFKEVVLKNRSYRRFDQHIPISEEQLVDYVDMARNTASVANKQPLKYIVSFQAEKNEMIFQHLAWAGYLKDWNGPQEGERPSGYIVVLGDTTISENWDVDFGIIAQTILLGATMDGLGGCMFSNIKRGSLSKKLGLPEHLKIAGIIALGKPIEHVVLEPLTNEVQYWRDEQHKHHVPKRALSSILLSD